MSAWQVLLFPALLRGQRISQPIPASFRRRAIWRKATRAMDGLVLREYDHPDLVGKQVGAMFRGQLPLQECIGGHSMLKSFVDVVHQCTLQVDWETEKVALTEEMWDELPVPLCTKAPLPEGARM